MYVNMKLRFLRNKKLKHHDPEEERKIIDITPIFMMVTCKRRQKEGYRDHGDERLGMFQKSLDEIV